MARLLQPLGALGAVSAGGVLPTSAIGAFISTPGSETLIVPAGVTSISVCAIGAGGRGGFVDDEGRVNGSDGGDSTVSVNGVLKCRANGGEGGNASQTSTAPGGDGGSGGLKDGGGSGGDGGACSFGNEDSRAAGGGGAGGYTGNGGDGGDGDPFSGNRNGGSGSGGGGDGGDGDYSSSGSATTTGGKSGGVSPFGSSGPSGYDFGAGGAGEADGNVGISRYTAGGGGGGELSWVNDIVVSEGDSVAIVVGNTGFSGFEGWGQDPGSGRDLYVGPTAGAVLVLFNGFVFPAGLILFDEGDL